MLYYKDNKELGEDMLYQVFARSRKTGEMLKEPLYVNPVIDSVDAAFELADELFGEYFQIKSCYGEGEFLESYAGTKPPYQRYDAIADAISEEKKFIAVHEAYHRIMQKHL